MQSIQERYHSIRSQVEKAGSDSTRPITLIAVSKFQSVDAIKTLVQLGHRDFGENYVQELLEKDKILKESGIHDIRWHFIGHLQRNKVKALVPVVHSIHAVDSIELAQEISKRWRSQKLDHPIRIFLEVNLHGEASKSGFSPASVQSGASAISQLEGVELTGLMCIPDPVRDPKSSFAELRDLEKTCQPHTHGELSMGMSSDYLIALEQGATHIRIGTSLFGERPHI